MKSLLLTLSIFLTVNSFAVESSLKGANLVCSFMNARKLVVKVGDMQRVDKFKHCAMSCMLSLRCHPREVYLFGVIKEFVDLIGSGTPELDDIKANKIGIELATQRLAVDDRECLERCDEVDWDSL